MNKKENNKDIKNKTGNENYEHKAPKQYVALIATIVIGAALLAYGTDGAIKHGSDYYPYMIDGAAFIMIGLVGSIMLWVSHGIGNRINSRIDKVTETVNANTEKLDELKEAVNANTEKLDELKEAVNANTEKLDTFGEILGGKDGMLDVLKTMNRKMDDSTSILKEISRKIPDPETDKN